ALYTIVRADVFRCSTCYMSCGTKLSLEAHMNKAHIIATCPKCDFQCEGRDALKKHYKILHAPYACLTCRKHFPENSLLMEHLEEIRDTFVNSSGDNRRRSYE
ncbi:hypothetical protein PMAYCL1PPCAC_05021, partial [Pristionchus mayeri]